MLSKLGSRQTGRDARISGPEWALTPDPSFSSLVRSQLSTINAITLSFDTRLSVHKRKHRRHWHPTIKERCTPPPQTALYTVVLWGLPLAWPGSRNIAWAADPWLTFFLRYPRPLSVLLRRRRRLPFGSRVRLIVLLLRGPLRNTLLRLPTSSLVGRLSSRSSTHLSIARTGTSTHRSKCS